MAVLMPIGELREAFDSATSGSDPAAYWRARWELDVAILYAELRSTGLSDDQIDRRLAFRRKG